MNQQKKITFLYSRSAKNYFHLFIFFFLLCCINAKAQQLSIANVHFTEGYQAFLNGKYEKAIRCFDRAIVAERFDTASYFNRGLSYWRIQDTTHACMDWKLSAFLGGEAGLVNYENKCNNAISKARLYYKGMVLPQIIYSNNSNDDKFDSVPEPVVGFDSLNDFLLANTQQESISQLVFQKINVPVRFKINSDGNISDVSGIYPQLQLTHEALRLTSLMPRWKPAYKNGKPVECEYIFNAVNFNYRKIKATKNYNIGVALLEQLQYKDALSSFNEAMKYYFGELNVFMNIGACYFGMHDTLRACGNWGMSALAGDTAAWRLINTWCDSMIINGNDTIRTNDMPEDSSGKKIYSIVEEMPKFPGGEGAMLEFIAKNIKYPGKARENGIQGRVYITFVINKDGEIKDARVLRGIGGGCDEAALHVINSMPRWKPGKQNGRPVQVQFNLPINFTIKVGK